MYPPMHPLAGATPVRFRWRFATGFAERVSATFTASSPDELIAKAHRHLPDVRADGLRGKLVLEAQCRFVHNGQPLPEWRSVGHDALPIDPARAIDALHGFKGRAFTEGRALADGEDPAAVSG